MRSLLSSGRQVGDPTLLQRAALIMGNLSGGLARLVDLWSTLGSRETAKALARLREDLSDRKLETGHDVSASQDIGFGEGGDVAR